MADFPLWRHSFWVSGTRLGWWSLALALGAFVAWFASGEIASGIVGDH